MSVEGLWEIARRILRAGKSDDDPHFGAMSNEDLDRWLEDHRAR